MRAMKFQVSEKRTERLTTEHVDAIREAAHERGWHSLALAQVLQFDLKLKQMEVIGEWVPEDSPGEDSDIRFNGKKWIRGLRWEEIDSNLVLRRKSKMGADRPRDLVFELKKYPRILEELEWLTVTPKSGAVVCAEWDSEPTTRPYSNSEYRRKWRVLAEKAGIPKNVQNSDTFRASDLDRDSGLNTGLRADHMH